MGLAEAAGAAYRVLVVDDEPVVADVLTRLLARDGHEIQVAPDAATARRRLDEEGPWDVVLLDLMLPDADGLELLRELRARHPELAFVVVTAYGSIESAVAAMKGGAFHYVTKPFQNEEVRLLVAQAAATTRLRAENRSLRQALEERARFERIVGKSKPMQEVYRLIEQVAPSRATVLICGESGTGKELVAHAIHLRSPRAEKPFLVVNTLSVPSELLEDNLFGHVRGAFTGAAGPKRGLLEVADGGTILFDEISSVSAEVQGKLLRVIQEKEFLPLGAVESRVVDVRILAATNEDLQALVRQGRFREDLYYRLNVIRIALPPLRERREDIPLLVAHFLAKYSAENRKQVRRVDPEAMEHLLQYSWPGNVRELENAIERGVVLARGETITADLLPREIVEHRGVLAPETLPEKLDFYGAVARYERQLIETALRQAGGVQRRAAERLGLKPTTLNEKIKRLGIRDREGGPRAGD